LRFEGRTPSEHHRYEWLSAQGPAQYYSNVAPKIAPVAYCSTGPEHSREQVDESKTPKRAASALS